MIITKKGQLKIGDKIKITGKSEKYDSVTTVKDILNVDDEEEVITNKSKNIYFITNMLLNGTSWAKEVKLLRD